MRLYEENYIIPGREIRLILLPESLGATNRASKFSDKSARFSLENRFRLSAGY